MLVKGFIKKGEYFDSVTLMIIAKEVGKLDGVIDSAVVMGTDENKNILRNSNMLLPEFSETTDNDLLIGIKAENEEKVTQALEQIDVLFKEVRNKGDEAEKYLPKNVNAALKVMPDANISLISVAGRYAAGEAFKALKNGINVMLFSDNVSIEEEKELKEFAREKGLLVMGPDCGTAIINGVPLAFANVVQKGDIGIVAASGTGAQEVSSVIGNNGGGVSQVIGTGGRDVKDAIGGIMFIEAMRALEKDDATKVITLVSKPPAASVLEKIAQEIKLIKKPVVGILIGGDPKVLENVGAIAATNLEEAGLISVALSKGHSVEKVKQDLANRSNDLKKLANEVVSRVKGKYIRGLFSGGTLCDETQLLFRQFGLGDCYGNAPLNEAYTLEDVWKSKENTIIDMGEDEFTVGRPHPMIDYSLRTKKIVEEAKDSDVAIILMDVVLGYGSNMDPSGELVAPIKEAKKIAPNTEIICSICGTDKDPQNRTEVKKALSGAGALVIDSNAAASELCVNILKQLGGK